MGGGLDTGQLPASMIWARQPELQSRAELQRPPQAVTWTGPRAALRLPQGLV